MQDLSLLKPRQAIKDAGNGHFKAARLSKAKKLYCKVSEPRDAFR